MSATAFLDEPSVLNEVAERPVTWTTVNAGEAAFPGVPTPLSWTWSWWPTEVGVRGAFAAMGPLPRAMAPPPASLADRILTLQLGRAALNVDLFRRVGDSTPGSSAADVERSFFGSVRDGVSDAPRRGRYPVVALKMPFEALRSRRRLRAELVETDAWWRAITRPEAIDRLTLDGARALLDESRRRYARIAVPHTAVGIVSQGLYDAVRSVCARAGMADRAGVLVPGGGEEAGWLGELWDVSQGRAPIAAFLESHGYHGPLEGELSSASWRDDPGPVHRLLVAYRRAEDLEPPPELFARRARERAEAQAALLAELPAPLRPGVRGVLAAARAYMPLRESGRATFLRDYDGARIAARAIGRHLQAAGVIEDVADVFYFTFDELQGQLPADPAAVVASRRELRAAYEELDVPNVWTGSPRPVDGRASMTDELWPVAGQGVSAGVAEGTARVVIDPADSDAFEPGDVLICRATDPSWAPLFFLASAVVIDIGGEMSHGAIVARELGLPAVVNTGDGTRRLPTGTRVRVDGSDGSVTPI